jgi:hypothetical protein
MNLLEESIAATLREHVTDQVGADQVDVGGLLDRSRRRGRTYRRRHRAWRAGGGTLLVVAAGLGTALVAPRLAGHAPGLTTGPAAPASLGASSSALPPASPSPDGILRLVFLPGAVTAAKDPTVVGSDRELLHVDLPAAAIPRPVSVLEWTSMPGVERLNLQAGPTVVVDGKSHVSAVEVMVTPDKSQLDPAPGDAVRAVAVGDLPATLSSSGTGVDRFVVLRWQPVAGLWAQLSTGGEDAPAIQLAAALTFDSVRFCAVPFRLDWVPPGAKVEICDASMIDGRRGGRTTIQVGKAAVTVEVDPGGRVSSPTTTIAGRPAAVREYPGDGGKTIMQVDIDYGDHVADLLAEGAYDRQTVLQIAAGYRDLTGELVGAWPVPTG